jgi:hypothetical protein
MTSSIFDVDWDTGEIRLRYGDLFAGAGGFTSGGSAQGLDALGAVIGFLHVASGRFEFGADLVEQRRSE